MLFGYEENVEGISFQLPEDSSFTKEILQGGKKITTPTFYIGGPVWSSKDYIGKLYPPKTKPTEFLAAYAKQLNSIEGNVTRRGLPDITTIENWKAATPIDFKFSLKIPEAISNRRLNSDIVYEELDKYMKVIERLGSRAGTSFLLLPHYFSYKQIENLFYFLERIPKELDLAIEQRNPIVMADKDYLKALSDKNISHIITDTPGRRDCLHSNLTNNKVYIRFSGANGHKTDGLRFEQWAKKFKLWADLGVEDFYFFIHQPNTNRGILVDSIVALQKAILHHIPLAKLKTPVDHSKKEERQQGLF